ncbi:U5 snRNP-specific protein-like factor [Handroanthus impetiginosus]|uniref:U5 snRNP-specific protein-like factor n=1 Tax=Handroanthus impetiginosus TaxID=429701 RepID=A0A2G9I3H2_9LAMI|nr:U5 snRNP-specific protein-like factor [Handroanthus impetiginosus]
MTGSGCDLQGEEDLQEVKSSISVSILHIILIRIHSIFSASVDNITSASVDGRVRIWTYDSAPQTSRNATIYCGAEIMSLLSTSYGGIKAWNVDTRQLVLEDRRPQATELLCSVIRPVYLVFLNLCREGTGYFDKLGFASLTVWNMRTWKATTVLPLGKDPPAITSLSFNHNGKLLAAAATDKMIHIFDMSAGQQVTEWPAHDAAFSSIRFGPDETSIIFEWSLHNQGKILWSRNCGRFCNPENSSRRHEMALDVDGRRLLVTSNTKTAPIYQVRGQLSGMRTLSHGGSITTVDWHPTLPIFLTGSTDHSVRVNSIL